MRTYGRPRDPRTGEIGPWTLVTTDTRGFDDMVWVTTLCQTLLLNLGESPFYADWGIPAHPSVITQVFPDFYVALTQQRFAPRFASLQISKRDVPTPTYDVSVVTHQGVKLNASVQVPF